MVYLLSWQSELPVLPENWQQYLPSWRIEKALSYKQEKDKVTCVLAFLLLRYALYKEYSITELPEINTDENSKPFFVNHVCHFNLSHCDTAVACALDSAPVGIDVQDFRPVSDNVIRRVCSPAEQVLLQKSEHPEPLFAAFWASKEAFGKCMGQGIGYDLKSTCFCKQEAFPCVYKDEKNIICTQLKDCFALSVCAQQQLQVRQVAEKALICFLQLL